MKPMWTASAVSPLLVVMVATLLCYRGVSGYPHGAPLDSCTSMFPTGHKRDAQTSDPPYQLSVDSTVLGVGQTITLTLRATGDPTYPYFEGMFVQARLASCEDDAPIGTFFVPSNDAFLKLLNCNNLADSAVSHKDNPHTYNVTFTWTPPTQYIGRIYFRATVVKNTETFWTNVFSPYLAYSNDTTQVPSQQCAVQTTGTASSVSAATSLLTAALVIVFGCL